MFSRLGAFGLARAPGALCGTGSCPEGSPAAPSCSAFAAPDLFFLIKKRAPMWLRSVALFLWGSRGDVIYPRHGGSPGGAARGTVSSAVSPAAAVTSPPSLIAMLSPFILEVFPDTGSLSPTPIWPFLD